MTAVLPERVTDRGLATTRWKTEKHGNNDEQKGHERDFALLAEPKRRRAADDLRVNLRELGIPGQRASFTLLGRLASEILDEEIAEPIGEEVQATDYQDYDSDPEAVSDELKELMGWVDVLDDWDFPVNDASYDWSCFRYPSDN